MYLATFSLLCSLLALALCQSNSSSDSTTTTSLLSPTTFLSPLPTIPPQGSNSTNTTSTNTTSPSSVLPSPSPSPLSPGAPGFPAIPYGSTWLLQTSVLDSLNDCGTSKDGLYVYPFHTGAGLGVAALSAHVGDAWQGFLNENDSTAWFTYPVGTDVDEGPDTDVLPWQMEIGFGPYQSWVEVDISIADAGQTGFPFYTDEAGLHLGSEAIDGFIGSWYVCDWWYGVPQLFVVADIINGPPQGLPPNSCSEVYLLTIPVGFGAEDGDAA